MGQPAIEAAKVWILLGIFILEAVSSTSTPNQYETSTYGYDTTPGMEATTTSKPVGTEIILDYNGGMVGRYKSSVEIKISSSSPVGTYYNISVRPNWEGSARQYKLLVTLEHMICDSSNKDRTHLLFKGKGSSGTGKKICQNLQEGKMIIYEKYDEIRISTSQYWNTDKSGIINMNTAAIRITAYYEPYPYCRCQSSLSFCCAACDPGPQINTQQRDFQTGYCIHKDLRCNYHIQCPCGAINVPDVEHCPWFSDDQLRVPMSIMMVYFVLGICVAVGIMYAILRFCRRRRRPVALAQSRTSNVHNPDAECPPPFYDSMNVQHSEKPPPFLDESPPPSYETIVKE